MRCRSLPGSPLRVDLSLVLRDPGTLGADRFGEGYQLTTSPSGLTLQAKTPHGLYNGVQTVRQLLPPWIDSPGAVTANWTMPVVRITDYPATGIAASCSTSPATSSRLQR